MNALLRFYRTPFSFLVQGETITFPLVLLHIAILGCGQLYLTGPNLGILILISCLFVFLLFVQTAIVDFTAHLLYGKSQSLGCFAVLALSWAPTLLDHAVHRLTQFFDWNGAFQIWSLIAFALVLTLQFFGLRKLYQVASHQVVFIFLSPLIVTILFFMLLVIGTLQL